MYPVSCRVNQLFRMACKTGTESTFYYNKDCLSYSNFTSHHLSLEPQLNKILNIGYTYTLTDVMDFSTLEIMSQ